jgi:hypothetical protein
MFDAVLAALDLELQTALGKAIQGLVATARTRLEGAVAEVAKDKAKGLAEVAEERAKSLAEVDARREELGREVVAMHKHKEAQEGHVELNIGGYRFETSVQTLRRVPHTFFDAYFSGRYAQDVCADGSIFVDRDGEHFGHLLEYMRDGHVSAAEAGARPSVSLLRALKREFGFYCIELSAEGSSSTAYVIGGVGTGLGTSTVERYDALSGRWSAAAPMSTARSAFGACAVAGNIYVTGGSIRGKHRSSLVEKYSYSSDTWSPVVPMPDARSHHATVAVGSAIYVLGGFGDDVANDDNVGVPIATAVFKFDSALGTWVEVAPMVAPRSDFAACAVGKDLYVFGGFEEFRLGASNTVSKYDTVANEWSTLAPMPSAYAHHSASVLDGLVYIVRGGNEVLRFDPTSGVWSSLAPTSANRYYCTSFVIGDHLYAAGGQHEVSVERYDSATNTWTAVADMLEARAFSCAVAMGSEEQDLFDTLIVEAANRL